MPRPKAPCGTISAYRRHLREGSTVDSACREAKRAHNRSRSNSAAARAERETVQAAKKAAEAALPAVTPAPEDEQGHVSRLEVLKEMLDDSRALVKALMKSDPARAYLQLREQREIIREISEIQGNGQVKGVTLADQLAEARARRAAGA